MKMKKIVFVLMLLFSASVSGKTLWLNRHALGLGAGITGEGTYSLSLDWHYLPCRYLGLGARGGYWHELPSHGTFSKWSLSEPGTDRLLRPFIMPSILLRSPSFIRATICSLNLSVEAGYMLNGKFNRQVSALNDFGQMVTCDYRSQAGSWYGEACIDITIPHVSMGVGYSLSTLELNKHLDPLHPESLGSNLVHGLCARFSILY